MNEVNVHTGALFACSVGMAPTTEAVAMMVKAVKMGESITNDLKLQNRVC